MDSRPLIDADDSGAAASSKVDALIASFSASQKSPPERAFGPTWILWTPSYT